MIFCILADGTHFVVENVFATFQVLGVQRACNVMPYGKHAMLLITT